MVTLNPEENEFIPEYLSRLEEHVLSQLSLREKNYSFRFNGLRRILQDVHQQKLSRALERLQEDQLIERFPDGGYGLDSNSYERIRDYYNKRQLFPDFSKQNSGKKQIYTVISAEHNFPVKSIIRNLKGKYFGDYRFIGHYYSNGEGRLEWIHAEDHSKILISSISASKIEIVTYNMSKAAISKFFHIMQQIFLDYQIITNFTDTTASSLAN
ncbi:MAG: hypothetical protein ACFFB2_10145 [Promethearchaeota archaeon]